MQQHLGGLAGDIHARHRILENAGWALHEMQLALEKTLLPVRRIERPVEIPQFFALFGMKQPGHAHAFQRPRAGAKHVGEGRVDFHDHAGGIGKKHRLARRFPNGTEQRLRLQQFLIGQGAVRNVNAGGNVILNLRPVHSASERLRTRSGAARPILRSIRSQMRTPYRP
jgi:hypothetical protein